MADDRQALKDMLLMQQVRSAGESSSKFRMCCQNTIIFLGAELAAKNDKVSNVPPWLPDRQFVRDLYLRNLTPLKILRTAELQHAEKDGTIDRMMSQVHTQITAEAMAEIVRMQYAAGLLSGDQRVTVKKSVEIAEGMYRRPFQ